MPRSSYFLVSKVGRISASCFDYSPEWIRKSVERSIRRLHPNSPSGNGYIDLLLLHDTEFVDPSEVLTGIKTLRTLRSEGKIKYIGISGYPVSALVSLSAYILAETGEPLDAIMSYANFTVQNQLLWTEAVPSLKQQGKVGVVMNASPLGMGLLRKGGVPVGAMGDWHPAPAGLREKCAQAVEYCEERGERLEAISGRWAGEKWMKIAGPVVGTRVQFGEVGLGTTGESSRTSNNASAAKEGTMRGITVLGVSTLEELEDTLALWRSIIRAEEGVQADVVNRDRTEAVVEGLGELFGDWRNVSWESPEEGWMRVEHDLEKERDE